MAGYELEPYVNPYFHDQGEVICLGQRLYCLNSENTKIVRVELGEGDYDHIKHKPSPNTSKTHPDDLIIFVDWLEERDSEIVDRLEDEGIEVDLIEIPDSQIVHLYDELMTQETDEDTAADLEE